MQSLSQVFWHTPFSSTPNGLVRIFVKLRPVNWRTTLGIPTDHTKARGLLALMLSTWLMWGGFFVIVPLVSLHFVDGLGWAAAVVGMALGIRTISQQGLSVFGGLLADRFDARGLILLGLAIRVFGFAALALVKDATGLLLAMLLSGVGGAFFEAPKNAAVAALTDPETRPKSYAVFGVIGNLGMGLGSLAGVLLHNIGFEVAALVSAGLYLLTFLGNFWLLPSLRVSSGAGHPLLGIRQVLRDRRFLLFVGLLGGIFLMLSQFSLSMTLVGVRLAGTPDAVAWIFLVNTVVAIVLQYPLTQWASQVFSPVQALALGALVMALALCGVGFAQNIGWLLVCVAVFSIGSSLQSAPQQIVLAQLAPEQVRGAYFGFGGLSLALGGGLGNVFGGVLLDWGAALRQPSLPWLVLAACGVATAIALFGFERMLKTAAPS
jgi:MFS transporter, DHA1 family, multidrug resistance protein